MNGAFYCKSISEFLNDSVATIRDSLTDRTSKRFYQQLSTQTNSWKSFIELIKQAFAGLDCNAASGILLEYPIPRRAKRIDAVLITHDLIFVIEYKDNQSKYLKQDIQQLEDYCLDLRDFHKESKSKIIIPVLLSPEAKPFHNDIGKLKKGVQQTQRACSSTFLPIINKWVEAHGKNSSELNFSVWNKSHYQPTPTIIEAAERLYSGNDVADLTRTHADGNDLQKTTKAILEAIDYAQTFNKKVICFVTGIPGAGKTLVGLNIVHERKFKKKSEDIGVFLSGNSPLVKLLCETLARDTSKRKKVSKKNANREVTTFIQNVHQFIDEYFIDNTKIPEDRVLIYDEAQRAWTREYKYRKSNKTIDASEPEILLSILDRFTQTWSVMIALVGNGQEINTGEGGLAEWGRAIQEKFSNWEVFVSPELERSANNQTNHFLFSTSTNHIKITKIPELHLNVSVRSFNAARLSDWVNAILENKPSIASDILKHNLQEYPIFITRNLDKARGWLRLQMIGTTRCGLLASSGARRLRPLGVDVNSGLKGTSTQEELGAWYLNPSDDIRSSNFLEISSSEFGIQGLEIDYACLCWDADLRRDTDQWDYKNFTGTKWNSISQQNLQDRQYLINTYRVLLTRARKGMIIFVPEGDVEDQTRLPEFYTPIYNYLQQCGIQEID